jgi:putative transposase
LSIDQKRALIEFNNSSIPVYLQCELLGLSKSTLYYQAKGISQQELKLMELIDEQFTKTPFYGIRRMTAALNKMGYKVNKKRVHRLMGKMGLEAIYPKRKPTEASKAHKIYPYLLRDVKIVRPNQVWSADITYVRLKGGFVYLVAIIDWFSRYVISWELSITLDSSFCLTALERALSKAKPEIFNSDQGSQFTADSFTQILLQDNIKISMDGRGRVFDNIFVERLWRSLKYEKIYLNDYETVAETGEAIGSYFEFYNRERPHQSLDYMTPAEVHFDS